MKLSALVTAPVRRAAKLTRMVFRRESYRWLWSYGSHRDIDYSKVGDGSGSSAVQAPVQFVCRTFPEAPPALWRLDEQGQEEQVYRHDLLRLLQRPTAYHTGPLLWMATLADWLVNGDGYWLKIRDGDGNVRQLWFTPSWLMEPKGDEATYITHYEYKPGLDLVKIDPLDVVHFRYGIDRDNPRRGSSPLRSIIREVYTDEEAAAFTASLLSNMGVPGLVVSPKTWEGEGPSQDEVDEVKRYVKEGFSGGKRGEPLVLGGPTEVAQFGFSPEQLTLRELRRIPEERISAVLGIPAIVAGLGAGLDRATFTNMNEAREAAYEAGIIPMQRILAEEIRFQLLTDFEPDPFEWRFGFDLKRVRVLQEDVYRLAQRLDLGVRGGWAQVAEAREALGLTVEEADRIFLRMLNVAEVSRDGDTLRAPAQGANGNRNGNGSAAHAYPQSGAYASEVAAEVLAALERRELGEARSRT